MKTLQQLVDELIQREGGYVNHPADPGGETKFGITVAVARKSGYDGPMVDLPREVAVAIYRKQYWFDPGYDQVSLWSPDVAAELFDTAVNMGVARAGSFLQRALNSLNRNGKDYPDLKVDNAIGADTITALRSFLRVRGKEGEAVLLKALEAYQGYFYLTLAEAKPKNEAFVYGWLRERIGQWQS